jgi:hypothetical protein
MVVGGHLPSGTIGSSEFSAVILWSLRIKCNIPEKVWSSAFRRQELSLLKGNYKLKYKLFRS